MMEAHLPAIIAETRSVSTTKLFPGNRGEFGHISQERSSLQKSASQHCIEFAKFISMWKNGLRGIRRSYHELGASTLSTSITSNSSAEW